MGPLEGTWGLFRGGTGGATKDSKRDSFDSGQLDTQGQQVQAQATQLNDAVSQDLGTRHTAPLEET
jgi:hypothetical protein